MPGQIRDLFNKYINNQCTAEEVEILMKYFDSERQEELNRLIIEELEQPEAQSAPGEYDELLDRVYGRINDKIRLVQPVRRISLWPRIAAAASVILCLGIGGYFLLHQTNRQQTAQSKPLRNDLLPGGNKAYLTLSGGKRITLTGAANGKIARQAGVTITKTADGQLVYQVPADKQLPATNEIAYNAIETPKGGQYQVILPDGSHVWLNAASSLKYPARFAANERKVELTGEAYFEVAHDPAKPFRVAGGNQVVEVLGTHFNISNYPDEPATLTTLLEGSVKINSGTILKPGQQARLAKTGGILVRAADTEEAVAWKNGYFMFSNESLESIMRKVGRWYNTEVVFKNEPLKQVTFSGTISKMANVSKVLRRLELTNEVTFKIENNKIIASAAISPLN